MISNELIISLVLSVPVAILVAIITAPMISWAQRWPQAILDRRARRSRRATELRIDMLSEHLRQYMKMRANGTLLFRAILGHMGYIVICGLLSVSGVLMAIAAGILLLSDEYKSSVSITEIIIRASAILGGLVVGICTVRTMRHFLAMMYLVNVEDSVSNLAQRIAKLREKVSAVD